jgi:hypothetical protein
MSNNDNKPINLDDVRRRESKSVIRKKYSKTSVRINIRLEPEERLALNKLQELLGTYAGGRKVSINILMRRMMNLYTAHLIDQTIAVDQRIEAGALPKSKRKEALAKAMEPEIAALMRAGGHSPKKAKQ